MNRLRIIGGQYRSRLINIPEAIGLRPTPDRVRETLFNWLGQDLEGWSCLDLFAGSGALGFEAASRGARQVTMVESAKKVVAHLQSARQQLAATHINILHGDGLQFLQNKPATAYDLIFLDPPYRQDWITRLAPHLLPHLAADGKIYVEAEHTIETLPGCICQKSGRAGEVYYHLFSPAAR